MAVAGSPSTSGGESSARPREEVSSLVRQGSGSEAGGFTAPGQLVGEISGTGPGSGAGRAGVPGVHVGAVGGVPAALVWILGHSFVFCGALRADVRPNGRQLGFEREVAVVRWLGSRGMVWSSVLREVHRFVRLERQPDILVLHVGGNDLGARPCRELIRDIKFDLLRLWSLFPGMITVWSDIVPRKTWREARSVERIDKARIKVNRAIGRFVARNGAVAVRHRELEAGTGAFWRADGVHLNAVGIDLWSLGLQDGIERALQLWRNARA